MAYITSADFVKWDGTLFTNSDWDANVDAVATLTSAGTRDSAWSKVGIGTTTLNYPLNIAEGSLSRGANISVTTATTTCYGQYISISGASSSNVGLFISTTGSTPTGNIGLSTSVEASGALPKGITSYIYGTGTASMAVNAQNVATGAVNTGINSTVSGATSGTNRALVASATAASTNYQLYCANGTTTAMSLVKLPYLASVDNSNEPTGTPDSGSVCVGYVSGVYKLYAYLSGAWKSVNLT